MVKEPRTMRWSLPVLPVLMTETSVQDGWPVCEDKVIPFFVWLLGEIHVCWDSSAFVIFNLCLRRSWSRNQLWRFVCPVWWCVALSNFALKSTITMFSRLCCCWRSCQFPHRQCPLPDWYGFMLADKPGMATLSETPLKLVTLPAMFLLTMPFCVGYCLPCSRRPLLFYTSFSLPSGLADCFCEVDSVQFVKPIIWREWSSVVRAYFQFPLAACLNLEILNTLGNTCWGLRAVGSICLSWLSSRGCAVLVTLGAAGLRETIVGKVLCPGASTTLQRQVAMARPCRPSDPWRPGIWAAVGIRIHDPLDYESRTLPTEPPRHHISLYTLIVTRLKTCELQCMYDCATTPQLTGKSRLIFD